MSNDEQDAYFRELANATEPVLVMARSRSFAEGVHEYRRIEAEFLARAAHDEFLMLETRRRILEMILREANIDDQPFQVCRDTRNELSLLGFSNTAVAAIMTWLYARWCLFSDQFDAGLAVLETAMTELQQRIDDTTTSWRAYYRDELKRLKKLRDELTALRKGLPTEPL